MRSRLTFFAVGIGILLGSGQTARPLPCKTLSFAERVAYQYAIEEIYWRHRIWPKENPGPKPALDAVMSRAQIEQKVQTYLRDSQLLADERQRPITPEQLQAEMERMAQNTKRPDVLCELFEALGNDPSVITECLARPLLAERLAARLLADDKVQRIALVRTQAVNSGFNSAATGNGNYALPEISIGSTCTNDMWTLTTLTNAPAVRRFYASVWTGSEMIVWGGNNNLSGDLNTGGRYDPSTDSWTATSVTNAPAAREGPTAVWTGSETIVWGGFGPGGFSNTGGQYNPSTDSWAATNITDAPAGRYFHTAVWTGNEMIVWGGFGSSPFLNTGGRYNPNTDSWIATSVTNAPAARESHTAIWTGSQMIIWAGEGFLGDLNTGGRYDPSTDSWTATSTTNAPAPRHSHTALWTGSEMIAWGGFPYTNTGGAYNPITDSWTSTNTTNAPAARDAHTAVWTGSEMIVWGGVDSTFNDLNSGGRYDPSTGRWTATSVINSPDARTSHTAVWTGSEVIVWGGFGPGGDLNSGGRYCAQPSAPIVQGATSRKTHGGVGSFDVNLPLSGTPGIECRSGGSTNDYSLVVTFLANVSVTGNPQAAVTLGTGTVGTGGVSNGGVVTITGNSVTIPLTSVANAQTINVTLFGVNGDANIVIPMSVLIGDTNANGTVNAADVAQTKGRLGQTVDATNCRSDVNANGSINAADTAIVKQNSGTSLPP